MQENLYKSYKYYKFIPENLHMSEKNSNFAAKYLIMSIRKTKRDI